MAKKKKEKKGGKHLKKKELVEMLLNYFRTKPNEAFSLKQLFQALKLTTHPGKMLCVDVVEEMVEDNFLIEIEKGRYKINDKGQILTGTFQRKSNGKNSFIPDDGGEPIFIAERNSAHAMNNDKVKVSLCAKCKKRQLEGQVIEILEHANETFVGVLKVSKNYAFLLTEANTLANDIFIPKDKLKGGKNGDKAVVRITEWPEEAKNPFGEVIDILGKAGDNTTEMHAILAEYGLPYTYPQAVEAAAEKLSAEITPEDYAEREDFRDVVTFTIDPKDAKDFDDALSIRNLKPRTVGGRCTHRRRFALCERRKHHRQGGCETCHFRLFGRPHHPDAAGTVVQLHLLSATGRGKAGLLCHLRHERQGRSEEFPYPPHRHQVQPPLHIRRSTTDY